MMRHLRYLLAISLLSGSIAYAQQRPTNQTVATITTTATVVENVDLIVMKELEFELNGISAGSLIISPQIDTHAGKMKIVGLPNSRVRVTFERQSILRHVSDQSQIYFTYTLSGNSFDVQQESVMLIQNNEIRLTDEGVYYLWLGGEPSGLEGIVPGEYTTELTINLEYIL